MSQYFPKPYEPFCGGINVKDDTRVDTSSFASKTNLDNLKTEVDKLDINKLKNLPNNFNNLKTKVDKLDISKLVPVPVDLSKLSNVIKNEVVKKIEYNPKYHRLSYNFCID